jgi:hypothetical protein
MIEAIKQAAIGAVEAAGPVIVQLGHVTSINPLKVMVDQRLELTEDFFIIPESLTKLEIDLKHTHGISGSGTTQEALKDKIIVRKELAAGDKLLLLRMQGGQRYVMMDRVVSP